MFNRNLVIIIVFIIVSFIIIGGGAVLLNLNSNKTTKPTLTPSLPQSPNLNSACPQDARLCPDGSSVGRTGPNCEFAQCPIPIPTNNAQNNIPSNLQSLNQQYMPSNYQPPLKLNKIYTNNEYKFRIYYPEGYLFDEKNWRFKLSDKSTLYFYILSDINFDTDSGYFPKDKKLKLLLDKEPTCAIPRKSFDINIKKECDYLFSEENLDDEIIIRTENDNEEGIVYGFIFHSAKSDFEKFIDPVQKIIQYFSVLSPEEDSLDVSKWQTYENKEFGFSLKYPPHLIKTKEVIIENDFEGGQNIKAIEFSSNSLRFYFQNDESRDLAPILRFHVYKVPESIFDLTSEEVSRLDGKEIIFGLKSAGVNYEKKLRIRNKDLIGVLNDNVPWGVGDIILLLSTTNKETLIIKYQAIANNTDDPDELLRIHLNDSLLPKVGIRKNEITVNNEHFYFSKILSTFKFIK